jgi:hypothetical protein
MSSIKKLAYLNGECRIRNADLIKKRVNDLTGHRVKAESSNKDKEVPVDKQFTSR